MRTERDCNGDASSCIEAQDFEIDKITAHSMYDTPKYANDIALIRLKRTTNSSKTPFSPFLSLLKLIAI